VLGVAAVALVAGGVGYVALSGPSIVIPDDPCAERPPMREVDGVRLQPIAMRAFLQAQVEAAVSIPVVQSYRSCAEQRKACRSICGSPQGCPDRCAPPGLSWHQLGAAIDITQEGVDDLRIVQALEANGWCQSLPGSDPGHFSFDGCH
jgi:D-alanyl-D-alanine carboxypeptidase